MSGVGQFFPGKVISDVAAMHCITAADIKGPKRSRHLVDAREDVTIILRERGLSLPQIGKILGGRDHTTIMNLEARSKRRMRGERFSPRVAHRLIRKCAKSCGVTVKDIRGRCMAKKSLHARARFVSALSKLGWSANLIAEQLNGRSPQYVGQLLKRRRDFIMKRRRAERKPTHKEG